MAMQQKMKAVSAIEPLYIQVKLYPHALGSRTFQISLAFSRGSVALEILVTVLTAKPGIF